MRFNERLDRINKKEFKKPCIMFKKQRKAKKI